MPDAFPVAMPLVLAVVLIASGVAKLRAPDDLAGWRDLGVPAAFRREWLRRLHPWAELALGVALAVLGGWLGLLAALVALALMLAYTVLVARVVRRSDDTSCACFGARKRVTRVTLVRNIWLSLLALVTAAVVWANPLLGGAVVAATADLAWVVALAVAAVTAALVVWPEGEASVAVSLPAAAPAVGGADDLDYIRTRTPAVPVTMADGTVVNLRTLAARKPILLLAVSSVCGPCESIYERRDQWRALLPEVDVRLLLAEPAAMSRWTERDEPQSLHDVEEYVAGSIGDWATPTAVLIGADGLLAGGPVTGDLAVEAFVGDVYESLHGERPGRAGSVHDGPVRDGPVHDDSVREGPMRDGSAV
jgi:hypothetical protein